jgi:hypothetical protein
MQIYESHGRQSSQAQVKSMVTSNAVQQRLIEALTADGLVAGKG